MTNQVPDAILKFANPCQCADAKDKAKQSETEAEKSKGIHRAFRSEFELSPNSFLAASDFQL